MSQFIESICRLYVNNKIDKEKIDEFLSSNKINQQEYEYIISAKKEV